MWTVRLDAAAASTPIVYGGAGGREFVAVVATGGSQNLTMLESDEVVAWSLP